MLTSTLTWAAKETPVADAEGDLKPSESHLSHGHPVAPHVLPHGHAHVPHVTVAPHHSAPLKLAHAHGYDPYAPAPHAALGLPHAAKHVAHPPYAPGYSPYGKLFLLSWACNLGESCIKSKYGILFQNFISISCRQRQKNIVKTRK